MSVDALVGGGAAAAAAAASQVPSRALPYALFYLRFVSRNSLRLIPVVAVANAAYYLGREHPQSRTPTLPLHLSEETARRVLELGGGQPIGEIAGRTRVDAPSVAVPPMWARDP